MGHGLGALGSLLTGSSAIAGAGKAGKSALDSLTPDIDTPKIDFKAQAEDADRAAARAKEAKRRALLAAKGRASTKLTGPLGLKSAAPVAKSKLGA